MLVNSFLFHFSLINDYLLLIEFTNKVGIFYITFERFNNIIYFEDENNILDKMKSTFVHSFLLRIVDVFCHKRNTALYAVYYVLYNTSFPKKERPERERESIPENFILRE